MTCATNDCQCSEDSLSPFLQGSSSLVATAAAATAQLAANPLHDDVRREGEEEELRRDFSPPTSSSSSPLSPSSDTSPPPPHSPTPSPPVGAGDGQQQDLMLPGTEGEEEDEEGKVDSQGTRAKRSEELGGKEDAGGEGGPHKNAGYALASLRLHHCPNASVSQPRIPFAGEEGEGEVCGNLSAAPATLHPLLLTPPPSSSSSSSSPSPSWGSLGGSSSDESSSLLLLSPADQVRPKKNSSQKAHLYI